MSSREAQLPVLDQSGIIVELKWNEKRCGNDHVLTKHASQREAQDDHLISLSKARIRN